MTQRDGTTYRYDADGVLATETTGGTTISYTQNLAAPLSQVLQTIDGGTTTRKVKGEQPPFLPFTFYLLPC